MISRSIFGTEWRKDGEIMEVLVSVYCLRSLVKTMRFQCKTLVVDFVILNDSEGS